MGLVADMVDKCERQKMTILAAHKVVRQLEEENDKLRALVHKNYYLTVSGREALRQARYDDDTYLKALDAEIMNAKNQMSELGIEVDV